MESLFAIGLIGTNILSSWHNWGHVETACASENVRLSQGPGYTLSPAVLLFDTNGECSF